MVFPDGEVLAVAGPVERVVEILYYDLDIGKVGVAKRMLDVTGHYSRLDIFSL